MNTFLNQNTADTLQQIAIFVEGLGLTLVIIEVFYTETARQIESALYAMAGTAFSIESASKNKFTVTLSIIILSLTALATTFVLVQSNDKAKNMGMLLPFGSVFMVLLFSVFWQKLKLLKSSVWVPLLMVIAFMAGNEPAFNADKYLFLNSLIIFTMTILFIPSISQTLIKIIAVILISFDKLAKNKALGVLGLILSSIGFLFETYQVAVLWWS